MKKIVMFMILLMAISLRVDYAEVRSDSISDGLGFDLPYEDWGSYQDEFQVTSYVEHIYKGDTYYVGSSRIEAAVYEEQQDSDYSLVIIRINATPYEVEIYYNWFYGYEDYCGYISDMGIFSDIDSATYYIYYPYVYYSSSGFEVEAYSPANNIFTYGDYSLALVHGNAAASATVSNDNILNITKSYDSSSESIQFNYVYSCGYSSCSGLDSTQRNNGMYLINKGNTYYGTTGEFINKVQASFTIRDENKRFGPGVTSYYSYLTY